MNELKSMLLMATVAGEYTSEENYFPVSTTMLDAFVTSTANILGADRPAPTRIPASWFYRYGLQVCSVTGEIWIMYDGRAYLVSIVNDYVVDVWEYADKNVSYVTEGR